MRDMLAGLPGCHSHRRWESRLVFPTEELDSRARLENDGGGRGWGGRAWIPGDAPRMTEKERKTRHGAENDGLDSRGCPENDGGTGDG